METSYERVRNFTHIEYNVKRTEPPGSTLVAVGSGEIDCESGRIMVWAMGTSDAGGLSLCASAPDSVDPALPIVCAREEPNS